LWGHFHFGEGYGLSDAVRQNAPAFWTREARPEGARIGLGRFESIPPSPPVNKTGPLWPQFVCLTGVMDEKPPGSSRGQRSRPRRRAANGVSERPLDGLARRASQSHPLRQTVNQGSAVLDIGAGCRRASSASTRQKILSLSLRSETRQCLC